MYIPGSSRGHIKHSWLDTYHTFSFGDYYEPARVHFGALRVLNEDTVAPGKGFGTHPHDNMEIITIPLRGALAHKDSMGSEETLGEGEVQVMTAGTGLTHSEYNASKIDPVHLLQIWVFPNKRELTPRYAQKSFSKSERKNTWQSIVAPTEKNGALMIHQNAFFYLGDFEGGLVEKYQINSAENGGFIMCLRGSIEVEGVLLKEKDACGFSEKSVYEIKMIEKSEVLLIEVPMEVMW